jgi:hypothetical protein
MEIFELIVTLDAPVDLPVVRASGAHRWGERRACCLKNRGMRHVTLWKILGFGCTASLERSS